MTSFVFDARLFQRGLTWEACVESWFPEREDFLGRVKQAPLLTGLTSIGERGEQSRIAVYFNAFLDDTRRALPAIAASLEHGGVTARYFDEDLFFPIFGKPFGRARISLILLEADGSVARTWSMDRPAGDRLDDNALLAHLDQSISIRFATAANPETADRV